MGSFTAAGTAYANYKVPTIPFYMYYSMFGFQRIGDMVWAFADSRGKGFLMGGTAGRTTMLGEGLQHQDGHSVVLASTVPTCLTYDPAYVYELGAERWSRLHPAEKERVPYLLTALGDAKGPIVAASDYMKSVPDVLSPWLPSRLVSLGTDGFGRSDNREHLRRHFEINAESIATAALSRLARDGKFDAQRAQKALQELGVSAEKMDPARA